MQTKRGPGAAGADGKANRKSESENKSESIYKSKFEDKSEYVVDVPKGLWCYRVDSHRVLVGGALTDGGSALDWVHRMTTTDTTSLSYSHFANVGSGGSGGSGSGGESKSQGQGQGQGQSQDGSAEEETARKALSRQAALLPPAAHGLCVLPFLGRERSPGWNDDASCALVGLRRTTTQAEVLRAMAEAVAYRLGEIERLLSPLVGESAVIVGCGGALAIAPTAVSAASTHASAGGSSAADDFAAGTGAMLRQLVADVCGRPVLKAEGEGERPGEEATAAGVAILVAQAIRRSYPYLSTHEHEGEPMLTTDGTRTGDRSTEEGDDSEEATAADGTAVGEAVGEAAADGMSSNAERRAQAAVAELITTIPAASADWVWPMLDLRKGGIGGGEGGHGEGEGGGAAAAATTTTAIATGASVDAVAGTFMPDAAAQAIHSRAAAQQRALYAAMAGLQQQ